jgi:O-antigen ligase
MSTWLNQSRRFSPQGAPGSLLAIRNFNIRHALWLGCLICLLLGQGIAITQSYLWAAPLLCLLLVMVVPDLPLVPFIGVILLARVLTDDQSSVSSRHSGTLNLSGLIAGLLIITALGLLIRHRRGLPQILIMVLVLNVWTAIAISTHGASSLSLREGVREMSIVAVAAIVYNARGTFSIPVVIRMIQIIGIASALLALYQLATHTGLRVAGEIRSNGTFAHPNDAVLFFAVATMASLWRYIDDGRHRLDLIFGIIYAAASLSTFSLGGLASLLVMLMVFGVFRRGSFALKVGSWAVAALLILVFLATPLGAERLASESSTTSANLTLHGGGKTSLSWRFYKWKTLIPEWERGPLFGQGLGTTTTTEDTSGNTTVGNLPHSEYVRYLVETGVVGLLILLCGVVILIRRLARSRGAQNAGILGVVIVVGFLINAVAANTLLYTPAAYAAAAILAAILAHTTWSDHLGAT